MPNTSDIALKEWSVVCEAIAQGRQQVLFRKGGIHEGPDGFTPEHQEFWLFPTGFHQSLDRIRPEFRDGLASRMEIPDGQLPLQHFCRTTEVKWVDGLDELKSLRKQHVLTDDAIQERFQYRRSGVFVLFIECQSLPAPVFIPNEPRYDGCRSWVRLSSELSCPS